MDIDGLSDNIITEIKELVKELRNSNQFNQIIRDDIFSYLERFSTVIYYPLDDETINGFHIKRIVNNELEEFVYINTANPVEKQIYTAAHELGHVWSVADKIENKIQINESQKELIVNRFAAELLLPENIFKKLMEQKLKELNYNPKGLPFKDFINLSVFLMNSFFVPFKAVVLRIHEVDRLKAEIAQELLAKEDEFSDLIVATIHEGQYTRLLLPSRISSIDNLSSYLKKAEADQLFSENKINYIKDVFNLNKRPDNSKYSDFEHVDVEGFNDERKRK